MNIDSDKSVNNSKMSGISVTSEKILLNDKKVSIFSSHLHIMLTTIRFSFSNSTDNLF